MPGPERGFAWSRRGRTCRRELFSDSALRALNISTMTRTVIATVPGRRSRKTAQAASSAHVVLLVSWRQLSRGPPCARRLPQALFVLPSVAYSSLHRTPPNYQYAGRPHCAQRSEQQPSVQIMNIQAISSGMLAGGTEKDRNHHPKPATVAQPTYRPMTAYRTMSHRSMMPSSCLHADSRAF